MTTTPHHYEKQAHQRVGDHPLARSVITAVLDPAQRFATRKTAISLSPTLTPLGKEQAVKEALPTFLKDLVRARRPLEKMRAEIKARRDALQIPPIDRSDTVGAIERAEIRSWFSSLPPHERQGLAFTITDPNIIGAILQYPDMSGLTGHLAPLVEQVKQRYAELNHGAEIEAIAAMEAVVAEVTAASQIAEDDLRRSAGENEGVFKKMMKPIERELAAPMLIKMKGTGDIVRVRPDKRGTPDFQRAATPDEIRDGIMYDRDKPDGALAEELAAVR